MPASWGIRPKPGPAASALAFSPDGRTLATGHDDGTILLWDATLRNGIRGGPPSAARAQELWADLANDAARAYAAALALADDAPRSIPALCDRLKPAASLPPERIKSLIADLDDDSFDTREAAEHALREFGSKIEPARRAALAAKSSLECKRRLEAVVAAIDRAALPGREEIRQLRAVMVLERIGTAEARQFLERLAGGVESARLTRAAKDALRRVAKK